MAKQLRAAKAGIGSAAKGRAMRRNDSFAETPESALPRKPFREAAKVETGGLSSRSMLPGTKGAAKRVSGRTVIAMGGRPGIALRVNRLTASQPG
jgi:hypothetical protein